MKLKKILSLFFVAVLLALTVFSTPAVSASYDFETALGTFPVSYHASLRKLHELYPKWQFVANYTGITFDDAIDKQYSASNYKQTRKVISMTYEGPWWRDPRAKYYDSSGNECWDQLEPGWVYASRPTIAYYMDPRTSLLNTMDIFVYLQQSYDSSQTEEALKAVVKGSFLANGYGGDSDAYIKDIMEAAKQSKLSPYVIASTIIIEQGSKGDSPIISGTYTGYEGYYNFFNMGAYGATKDIIYTSGLKKAKDNGWNTRRASIIGGAKAYSSGYTEAGQDTYYYMGFNVINKNYNHQYATNVRDPWQKALSLREGFFENREEGRLVNTELVFKIPVYSLSDSPNGSTLPNELSPRPSSTTPTPSEPDPPKPTYIKGDINGDGAINSIDAARIRKHILGIESINLSTNPGADTNGDGAINAIDAAFIRKHILGIS